MLNSKIILITGASSGIGRACAHQLSKYASHLILISRSKEKLECLQEELSHITKVSIIASSVCDKDIEAKIKKVTPRVDILVNNAGLALGKDPVASLKYEHMEEMIQTNVLGNFNLSRIVLPMMLEHQEGDIINICSIAGHYSYMGGSVYCATKHAVKAFTRAMREETCGKNIRVMEVSPGMVETNFSLTRFGGDQSLADAVYQGMTPLTPADIAEIVEFMATRPRHVVLDEIITMPTDQGSPSTVCRR
ncbi:MAG TPA: SDR family NAD(P)-dependent oxidoreductase [Bacteriovoracaceae bacterium]|nr:SDR family NAD(P)-dependent oxidoreductase [Bacteriovoracaceae bacterium]